MWGKCKRLTGLWGFPTSDRLDERLQVAVDLWFAGDKDHSQALAGTFNSFKNFHVFKEKNVLANAGIQLPTRSITYLRNNNGENEEKMEFLDFMWNKWLYISYTNFLVQAFFF